MNRQEKLIAEIHNEFDTAQERLLSQAREVLKSVSIEGETSVELVADRLAKIGFVNTPIVKQAGQIKEQKSDKIKTLVKNKEEAELIEYYKATYPFLKFLTEDELNRICDKYELIHAPVGNYIKNVPEKNLREIENSQELKDHDRIKDKQILVITKFWRGNDELQEWLKGKEIVYDDYRQASDTRAEAIIRGMGYEGDFGEYVFKTATVEKISKDGFFIAAPKTHFNLDGLDKKSKHGFFKVFKTEITDPIVFRYVRGGIQVLSKWGLEANDPSLVVPVLN